MLKKMKAVGYHLADEPPIQFEQSIPIAKGHDVLVKISAISVNPIDIKIKAGITDRLSNPRILGWDAMGTVIAAGDKTTLLNVSDKIYYAGDISRSGSYSQYQLVDERLAAKAPVNIKPEQSAAMPLTSITAWEALFSRLKIIPGHDDGKTILIIGGGGGVGSIAIQLAKVVANLHVIATASRPETEQWCAKLGADEIINHHSDLIEQYRMLKIEKPDYILCLADTDQHFSAMTEIIAPEGMICSLVNSKEKYDMNVLKTKSAGFVWEFMFTKPMFKTKNMVSHHNILSQVASMIDEGKIISTLQQTIGPITPGNITMAHQKLLTGKTVGKIALTALV